MDINLEIHSKLSKCLDDLNEIAGLAWKDLDRFGSVYEATQKARTLIRTSIHAEVFRLLKGENNV